MSLLTCPRCAELCAPDASNCHACGAALTVPKPSRGIKPGSQNARVLEVLRDGREHSMNEIHRLAGTCRLNSRIAELRNPHGHNIVCWRENGTYYYQLVSSAQSTRLSTTDIPAAVSRLTAEGSVGCADDTSNDSAPEYPSSPIRESNPSSGAEQLSLAEVFA